MGALREKSPDSKLERMLAKRFAYEDVEELEDFPLGRAVAASACVPLVFPPVRLPLWPFAKEYLVEEIEKLTRPRGEESARKRAEREESARRRAERELGFELVDGGVVDNLGLGPLEAGERAIVSNASAAPNVSDLRRSRWSMIAAAGRSLKVLLEKTQQAADLQALTRLGENMTQVSLGRLEAQCEREEVGIEKESLKFIQRIRTDLDSFTDWEAHALMYAGYLSATVELGSQAFVKRYTWPFEWIGKELKKGMAFKHLGAASSHLKSVRLLPGFVRRNPEAFKVLGAVLVVYPLIRLYRADAQTFETLPNALMTLAAFLLLAVLFARFFASLAVSLFLAIVSWASLLLRFPLLRLGGRPAAGPSAGGRK